MRMSFRDVPAIGIPRSALLVRVAGDCVESGGSAHASRKTVANVAKTSRASTLRILLMPAPTSVAYFRGTCLMTASEPHGRRRNIGLHGGPEVHLNRGRLCGD